MLTRAQTFSTTARVQIARITVVGNVGQDIEVTELPSGTVVGNYSVASTVGEKTSWFRITTFNPSEYVRERIKKGTMVFVDGEASIDKYNDEASGKTLSALRVVQSTLLPPFPFFSNAFLCLARIFVPG
jgi:single stranded DNA-binding protein